MPPIFKGAAVTIEAELPADQIIRLPIVEETLNVVKRRVETGRVRATSSVVSHAAAVREHLTTTSVRVERVPIDRFVDVAPLPRTEGLRTILSVTEEVLVKRIRVIEEVHLISEAHTDLHEEMVTLRRLDVTIERTDLPGEDVAAPPTSHPESPKT